MNLIIDGVDLIPIIRSTLVDIIEEKSDPCGLKLFVLNEATDEQLIRVITGGKNKLHKLDEQTLYGAYKNINNKIRDAAVKYPKTAKTGKVGAGIMAAGTLSVMFYKMIAKKYIDDYTCY